MERRTLIRLLVGLGIGLPIAIEGATFLGLFESRVLDGDGDTTPMPDGQTSTPSADLVGVGDELLPSTPQAETVTAAEVRTMDGDRVFQLTVQVVNDTEDGYELRLNALTTNRGTTVSGGGRTDRLAPGEQTSLTGEWVLPEGETPAAMIVVATVVPPSGERQTATRRVELAPVG